jgi:DNA-binding MarR family transcriptional regulator
MRNNPEPDGLLSADVRRLHAMLLAFGRRRPLRDPLGQMLEATQLTPPQIHLLLWLGHDGPLTMGELCRRCGVTEKTMTGLVDRLEKRRLVERERDAKDRRVIHARLTPAGRETFRHLERHTVKKLGLLLGLLDGEDRRQLLRIVESLLERFTRHTEAEDGAASPKQAAATARTV